MTFDSVLYVPSVQQTQWVTELLPWWSPAQLMICGRRLLDFCLERTEDFRACNIEILDWKYSERLANEYSASKIRPYAFTYTRATGPMPRGLDDLVACGQGILASKMPNGLAVAWGLCLSGHMPEEVTLSPVSPEDCRSTPMGFYLWLDGKWMQIRPIGVALHDVKTWHKVSMAVLHTPGKFSFPCYSAEEGVYLGRNVVIEHGAEITGPVLLADNTWIGRNVQLEGDVIVSHGAVVGEGTRLKKTVVGANTYIGHALDLENKIVAGSRIIDAETGAWTDLEEPGLARYMEWGLGWLAPIWRFLRGRSHGRNS